MSDVAKHLRPAAGDNVAIVTARIEAGEVLGLDSGEVTAPVPVLPGHRICVEPVRAGEDLLSWGLPFGTATTDIAPGDYVCNARVRDVLLMRHPEAYDDTLTVNFVDRDTVADRILPTSPVHAPTPVDIDDAPGFPGFRRGPDRGWGTRNYLAVVGVTSRSRRVVLEAARRLAALHPAADDFDGIVPVVHTEGGGAQDPRNRDLLVRTLAGFVVNANLGAAVVVNDAEARVTNAEVHAALVATGVGPQEYAVRYHVTGEHDEDAEVEQLVALAEQLLPRVMRARREPAPISALRIALQCGGSDAFSGVSANQVVGSTGHELVRRGGVVNLAETDELIGAEQYLLDRVADAGVAEGFLHRQQRFKDYAAAHGQTAEGNVSGGNLYRGLYNITLKSLGAARKKDPATSLDRAIDYAERMVDPGYHFMDSPGNDLESIAGQVASGANLVLFTTGNGSITNFPFVPTLKVVTTTERYDLLASDMDVDAGQVLSGRPVADVGRELYELARETAGGRRTKGEGTGQFQTQVWRDWYADLRSGDVTPDPGPARRSGDPAIATTAAPRELAVAAGRVSLVLPTSLCSGQVAEQIVARAAGDRADRVVALPHTEGCGVSGGNAEDIFRDTLVGYATHPSVEGCVFLEHGCEKTHNDYFRTALVGEGIDPGTFRWASIQAEGGIEAVGRSVERALADLSTTPAGPADGDAVVQVGLTTSAEALAGHGAALLADLVADLLDDGVGVVLASTDPLLQHAALPARLGPLDTEPTLAYSQRPAAPGLHVMDSSSTDWLEIATGLGATGCRVLVTTPAHRPWQPHRFLPTLQLGLHHDEKGLDHQGTEPTSADVLGRLVRRTLSGEHEPRTRPAPDVGFQISRGRFGVSL